MTNYADQSGPGVYGRVNLIQALVNSINSVFCNIGKEMGPKPIVDYMKRYGFYSVPPLETPVNERRPSGLYKDGKLFSPENAGQVDPGRLAFGQERLQVTPLQMAMVAAGVANGGERDGALRRAADPRPRRDDHPPHEAERARAGDQRRRPRRS